VGFEGTTFTPEGEILEEGGRVVEHPGDHSCLLRMAMCSALCNDSIVVYAAGMRQQPCRFETLSVVMHIQVLLVAALMSISCVVLPRKWCCKLVFGCGLHDMQTMGVLSTTMWPCRCEE
jgi:hypothetical protein